MADDDTTFRQERKKEKIDMSDIIDNTENTPNAPFAAATPTGASLADVLAFQRAAGLDVPNEQVGPVRTPMAPAMPQPKDGVSVTGKMPPAMQQMMQQRIAQMQAEETGQSGPQQSFSEPAFQIPPHQQNAMAMQPGQIVTNDPNLNALLGVINTQNYEEVMLPSRGRFYHDTDTPTSGVLHIRPMTGQEETILLTARFMRQGRGIEMIFRNCIQERNINPEKFLSVDRTFLLIYLRAISYGNLYQVNVKCPECSHAFDEDIDLNLHVDFCPDDFTVGNLTRTLPKTKMRFSYMMMTGAHESEIAAYRERKTKFANSTDDTFLYKASVLITEIGNDQATVTNRFGIQSLLEKLPVADVNAIRNTLNNPPFGVNTEIDVLCPSCNAEFPVEMPYEANFFFPRERTETEQQ